MIFKVKIVWREYGGYNEMMYQTQWHTLEEFHSWELDNYAPKTVKVPEVKNLLGHVDFISYEEGMQQGYVFPEDVEIIKQCSPVIDAQTQAMLLEVKEV